MLYCIGLLLSTSATISGACTRNVSLKLASFKDGSKLELIKIKSRRATSTYARDPSRGAPPYSHYADMGVFLLLVAFPIISLAVVVPKQVEGDGSVVNRKSHVTSDIVARHHAYTQVNSVVLNSADNSKEPSASFQVQLSETAFVSNFTM